MRHTGLQYGLSPASRWVENVLEDGYGRILEAPTQSEGAVRPSGASNVSACSSSERAFTHTAMAGDGDDSDLRGELERLRRENDDLKRILYSQGTGSDMAAGSGQEADAPRDDAHLSIIVIGASGDLAKKKTYPALLALYNAKVSTVMQSEIVSENDYCAVQLLPSNVDVIGYARTSISAADFRSHITSKRVPEADQQEFLARCTYQRGSYA